ncbi:MAG TPA: hypothetical protein IAC03_04565 [Candidatus Coprenecus pullistercoris]|nr:hypothetical protein [Candidatus Coprenecus pullistercoris]
MRIDIFYTIVTVAISALLSWGEYSIVKIEDLKWVATITTFIALVVSGLFTIALKANTERAGIVMHTIGGIFLFILLVLNFTFAFFEFSVPLYIIVNALLLLIMILIIRFTTKHT